MHSRNFDCRQHAFHYVDTFENFSGFAHTASANIPYFPESTAMILSAQANTLTLIQCALAYIQQTRNFH